MASVALVLAQYPDDVIVFATSPLTGVQRRCKWPPSIAEIIDACDARMQTMRRRYRLENWGKRDEPLLIGPPREERPTYDELKAKYGEHWGMEPPAPARPKVKAPSWDEIIAKYQSEPGRIARLARIADEHAEARGEASS